MDQGAMIGQMIAPVTAAPEPPPRLPAVEADLAAWAAYAAQLRAAGDPRGALMELDLSLPALVEREALRAFHEASTRLCRQADALELTWCLAHVRSLGIWSTGMIRARSPEHGSYARARDVVRGATGQRLEHLATVWPALRDMRHWRRLMKVLPSTCRSVELSHQLSSIRFDELVATLPETVRELVLHENDRLTRMNPLEPGTVIDDRFDIVDIGGLRPRSDVLAQITAGLTRTHHVKIRVTYVDGPTGASPRVLLGEAGDASLVDREHQRRAALRRWSPAELQRRFGILPARAQIARLLPEAHAVGPTAPLRVAHGDADVVQRGDVWTVRGAFESQTALNERVLAPGEVVTLAPGDQLRFGEVACELRPGERGAT